jgi:hypothetical protein
MYNWCEIFVGLLNAYRRSFWDMCDVTHDADIEKAICILSTSPCDILAKSCIMMRVWPIATRN